jgi:hypothetical protein
VKVSRRLLAVHGAALSPAETRAVERQLARQQLQLDRVCSDPPSPDLGVPATRDQNAVRGTGTAASRVRPGGRVLRVSLGPALARSIVRPKAARTGGLPPVLAAPANTDLWSCKLEPPDEADPLSLGTEDEEKGMAAVDEDYQDDEEMMEERDQSDFKTFLFDAAGADQPPGGFNQGDELPTD